MYPTGLVCAGKVPLHKYVFFSFTVYYYVEMLNGHGQLGSFLPCHPIQPGLS